MNILIPCYMKAAQLLSYLLGDINISLVNYAQHNYPGGYLDSVYTDGFISVINHSTRVTNHNTNLIGYTWVNYDYSSPCIKQSILVSDLTRHFQIFRIAHFEKNNVYICGNDIYSRTMYLNNCKTSNSTFPNVTGPAVPTTTPVRINSVCLMRVYHIRFVWSSISSHLVQEH